MRQLISEKISNAILDWRDGETVHLLEFQFPIVTGNQRNSKNQKTPEVTSFQELVEGVAREMVDKKAQDEHLGARIAVICLKRNFDMDNCAKSIFDGLKQIAFNDDKVFDYLEMVRVKADTKDDVGFTVELVRLVEKREAWV